MLEIGFSLSDAVKRRYSVRTYDPRQVDAHLKKQILEYAALWENPLGPQPQFRFAERSPATGERLGTYGFIKGASLYLGALTENTQTAPEALGYAFEQVVLYITSLGLGTCWLGGTFDRSAFAKAMGAEAGKLFPIVSPVGYPAQRPRTVERLFRGALRADGRKPWEELFFCRDFSVPLSRSAAGDYAFALDMVRLAPSAVNRQPWRIVLEGNTFHFFEKHTPGGESVGSVDMQRIDVGIAACHFHLAAMEAGLCGRFERNEPQTIRIPEHMTYITSWIME